MCYFFHSKIIYFVPYFMTLSLEKLCAMIQYIRLVFARIICQLINQICTRGGDIFALCTYFRKKISCGARTKWKNCAATDILTLAQFVIQFQKLQSIRNQSHERHSLRVGRKKKCCMFSNQNRLSNEFSIGGVRVTPFFSPS